MKKLLPPSRKQLTITETNTILQRLETFAEDTGIKDTIRISEEVATLIHELAHAQLNDKTRVQESGSYWSTKDVNELQVSIKEFQAEMVSYVVSSHYGIDTKEHAIPYISAWTNNGQEFYGETSEEQVAIMDGIQKTCKDFIQQLDQYYEKDQSVAKETKQSQEVVTIRKTNSTSNVKNVVKGYSR
ncbi:TPA: hypothetical protein ACNKKJ_002652 [Enterococcus faecalis]